MYQITRENPEIKLINESEFSAPDLDNYSVILAVLTPNLAKEKVVIKGLDSHGKKLKSQNKLISDGVARIFKVLKRPFDPDEHLPELEDLLTYDFYLVDPLTGDPQEFTRFFGLLMFGSFSVINIIVLLNLLIAMMNHSYQLISVSSVSSHCLFSIYVLHF